MAESRPDGVDVVATREQAVGMAMPPLLVLDAVGEWLDGQGIGPVGGALSWERIGDGQSNITYLVRRGDGPDATRFVVRRGPRPPLPPSAHDMVRESRVQRVLGERGVRVPRILGVCEDESVLGVPFYVMEHLDGVVVTDTDPPALSSAQARGRASEAVVDTLVALHAVDVADPAVAALGRPEGYLARQVRRFAGLWPEVSTRELDDFPVVTTWLADHVPEQAGSAVVHGDYRLGNLMLDASAPGRVLAVLDWEMATLGDPLADLGYLTATWSDPAWEPTVMDHSSVTRREGWWSRADLAEAYARRTGQDLSALGWYQALAMWKSAVFCEAMYTRWLRGERAGDTTFAPFLEEGVPGLLARARSHAGLGA
ncbi:phosphotransferase family protein [Ornithinimicrobium flavum]|uniref:phosphotransferase family protein n=1 Tax=Ornithinimicrobium flavum TaxID=1288636 RepID=UPI00106F7EDE|nr:phosphotransferase family protein [Ornithinimicrobium flavum]